jgi:hypothetical protein
MKTTRIGSPRQTDSSLWPVARRAGSVIAYAGIPLSTFSSASGLFNTWNVQTSFYLVTILGLIAALRGARFSSSLIALSYFLMAWYVVLLSIELFHGGPFHFRFPRGANFLTDYFPLVALPFFTIGLKETKADLRIFEYAMMGTIVFSAGLSLYQFFIIGDERPRGFSLNPIPFALIVLMWSLFVFSRALQTEKIDWPRLATALVGLVPIVLSGSKLVWLGAAFGYSALFVMWVRTSGRWRVLAATAITLVPVIWVLWQVEVLRGRITEFSGDLGSFLASGNMSGPTFGLRYAAAVSGLHAFLDRPLLGYGLAEGRVAALEHRPPGISSFAQLPHLHSDYVTHLAAFGVLGLIFLVSLFAAFILASLRRNDIAVRRFGVVAGILFLIYMTVEVIFTQPELSGLVFFLFGLILLAPERLSASQRPETRPWRLFRISMPSPGPSGL